LVSCLCALLSTLSVVSSFSWNTAFDCRSAFGNLGGIIYACARNGKIYGAAWEITGTMPNNFFRMEVTQNLNNAVGMFWEETDVQIPIAYVSVVNLTLTNSTVVNSTATVETLTGSFLNTSYEWLAQLNCLVMNEVPTDAQCLYSSLPASVTFQGVYTDVYSSAKFENSTVCINSSNPTNVRSVGSYYFYYNPNLNATIRGETFKLIPDQFRSIGHFNDSSSFGPEIGYLPNATHFINYFSSGGPNAGVKIRVTGAVLASDGVCSAVSSSDDSGSKGLSAAVIAVIAVLASAVFLVVIYCLYRKCSSQSTLDSDHQPLKQAEYTRQ